MTIKRIIGIGDSYMFGDELVKHRDVGIKLPDRTELNSEFRKEKCFLGQLARRFQAEAINLGYPGASLRSMRDALTWYIQEGNEIENSLLLVGITQPWRESWYNQYHKRKIDIEPKWNNHVHSSWIFSDLQTGQNNYSNTIWNDQFKIYMEMQDCEKRSTIELNQSLLFFDGIGKQYNIPVVQVNVFVPPGDPTKRVIVPSYYEPDASIDGCIKPYSTLKEEGGHPSVKGHRVVADWIQSIIDREKLI